MPHIGNGAAQLIAETDAGAGGAIVVDVQALGPRAFRLQVTPDASQPVATVRGGFVAAPDEHFVGLGERFDAVDQRGKVVDVWAEERRVANYGATTYAPVPLVLSSRGHGFALERFERSSFDLAAARGDRWTWQQAAPSASILVSYGPSLKDLVRRNAELTGLPPLPPPWLFGVWKTAVGGQTAGDRRDAAPAGSGRAHFGRVRLRRHRRGRQPRLALRHLCWTPGWPVLRPHHLHRDAASAGHQGPQLLHRGLPHRSAQLRRARRRTAS